MRQARWCGGLMLALVTLLAACGASTTAGVSPTATATGAAVTLPAPRYQITQRMNVAYGPLPAEVLDLCAPVNAPGARPGIALIHGGGWSAGTQHDEDGLCKFFAGQGLIAIAINYRLAPAAIWPAQLVDVQLAIRWLRSQATTLHLASGRLCAWGDSAGAHLALFAGLLTTIHPGDEATLLADQSPSAPTCVVDLYGPTDLTALNATPTQLAILKNLFGGATPAQQPALYRDASPIELVTATAPPTWIVQGTQDTLVPPAQSQELLRALTQAHVPATLVTYPGEHAFSGLSSDQRLRLVLQAAQFVLRQTGD